MSDSDDALERRLAAVERALDGDPTVDRSDSAADPEALETRVRELETRIDELDAAVQAVRGFLGGVSAVNERVERRADAAVAAVDRLERRLDDDAPGGVEPGEPRAHAVDADSRGDGSDDSPGDDSDDSPGDDSDDSRADDSDDRRLRDRLGELQ